MDKQQSFFSNQAPSFSGTSFFAKKSPQKAVDQNKEASPSTAPAGGLFCNRSSEAELKSPKKEEIIPAEIKATDSSKFVINRNFVCK